MVDIGPIFARKILRKLSPLSCGKLGWTPVVKIVGIIRSNLLDVYWVILNPDIQELLSSSREIGLQSWLKPVDEVEEERTLQRIRQWPNTCHWIFSKASYCDWMLGVLPRILWCHARPGSGKSVLSSFLAQQFLDAREVCCFFPFRYNNEALRDPQNLLRTSPSKWQNNVLISGPGCWSLARKFWMSTRLDWVCSGRRYSVTEDFDFSQRNQSIGSSTPLMNPNPRSSFDSFRFSPISRPPKYLSKWFCLADTIERLLCAFQLCQLLSPKYFQMTTSKTYDYLQKNVLLRLPLRCSTGIQAKVLDSIVKRSGGTFLWVAKAVDALEQQELIAGVLNSVDDSSQGLSSLYDDIFNQMGTLGARRILIAKTILGWTTCAAHPLSLAELGVALKAEFGVLTDVASTVKNLCGQLLGVDKQQRVQANHMTVQEYLRSNIRSEFYVDSESWNYKIACFCLEILAAGDSPDESDDEGAKCLFASDAQAFREYACLFWHVHVGRTRWLDQRVS